MLNFAIKISMRNSSNTTRNINKQGRFVSFYLEPLRRRVSVSCSSIFVFKGIVYDVVHTRLSKSCGMEVYSVEKSNV